MKPEAKDEPDRPEWGRISTSVNFDETDNAEDVEDTHGEPWSAYAEGSELRSAFMAALTAGKSEEEAAALKAALDRIIEREQIQNEQ